MDHLVTGGLSANSLSNSGRPATQPASGSSAKRPKIEIRGLSKRYGNVIALRPIDLEVENGEFLTLLGPSGSGKTTLLQLVAGLTAPSSGTLQIDGRDATDLHPSRRDIGMVFQNYALFPHLSVFENIAFPLRMRHRPDGEIRVEVKRALDMVRLPNLAHRFPKELSGGQQQRIALARCLVYSPTVILMDEPLGALDKKLREHMQLEIKRIHRDTGTTILYVTHDQEEALSMSDRICLMRDGAIAQWGTPKQLYFEPRSAFVADFMGQPNLIDGTVAAVHDSGAVIDTAAGSFQGHNAVPLAEGERVKMLVRTEKLQILKADDNVQNRLSARIVDISPIGALTKLTLEAAGEIALQASFLSEVDDRGLAAGDEVALGWDAVDGRILPWEGPTP